ncbi:hypothetical protein [Pontibacter beigongshangensis]|uniref:hypothetical protein n=1 Tax=Pontibacter beigongshangensis TaxID=2574733 RepID=UPI0016509BA2|nr:hypothetical protein [Pontibacter beigongshangensis]
MDISFILKNSYILQILIQTKNYSNQKAPPEGSSAPDAAAPFYGAINKQETVHNKAGQEAGFFCCCL